MNPITKAIDEIRFSIPPQILNEAFLRREHNLAMQLVSLDTIIREQVLEPRVMVDIDLHGGTETYLPLSNPVRSDKPDPYTVIYHIPDEVTQNRPIVQVFTVHFGILGFHNAGLALHAGHTSMDAANRQVLDSAQQSTPAQTSYLNLIAHNTVMARFVYMPRQHAYLRCRLGNDNALSHIRPQAFPAFSEMCVNATKAWIYNQLNIRIDQGQLSGGQMLGTFREVVQNYADAEERYQENLRGWKKQMVWNDPEVSRRFHRTLIGLPH